MQDSILKNSEVSHLGGVCTGGGCDPRVHINISIDASPDSGTYLAFQQAIDEWNAHSYQTNTVFDPVDPPYGQLKVQVDNNEYCGGNYNPSSPVIGYSPDFEQITGVDSAYGKFVFAHELGHFLGLDEAGTQPPTGTVMNQHAMPIGMSCANTWRNMPPPTLDVQSYDADMAGSCTSVARNSNPFWGVPPGTRSQEVGDGTYCYDQWEVTYTYDCSSVSGCVLTGYTEEYLGRFCE